MKTYIVYTEKGFVATQANNKVAAWEKVRTVYPKALKSSVLLSSCDIAYCSCQKLYNTTQGAAS